jgi:cytochrome P450
LPYLQGVVKETLRLFPPRALGVRVLAEDGDLGAWHLPKGTIVIHSPYATHRDAAVYDKPELFLPHRFQYHQPSAYEFVPLGDLAPAAPLVEHLSQLLIGAIYQRYRPSLVPNQTIQRRADVALEPAGPLAMFFVRDGMIFPVSAPRGAVTSMVEFAG